MTCISAHARASRRRGATVNRSAADRHKDRDEKAKASKEYIGQRNHAFGGLLTDEETWKAAGIGRATFYMYKKEMSTPEHIDRTQN